MIQNKSTVASFRFIFLLYISVISCFTILYLMPFSNKGHLNVIDSIFVSTSALSVTGLSSIDISSSFTFVGKTLLILEMQLGGVGILVLVSYLFLLTGKKITISSMLLISKDQNQDNLKTIKSLSFSVLIIALFIEAICALFIYKDIQSQYSTMQEAVFISVFHSVASFTNSGFSLFDMNDYQTNGKFLIVTGLTIFIGSIGYPTIMEYIFSFKKKKSLFTKINIQMHSLLLLLGAFVYFSLEYTKVFADLNVIDKITNALFLSAATRSGGLTTFDISQLTITTILVVMCLMFIGGASSSTGGGIRLTTFRVLLAKMNAVARSQEHTVIGKKSITQAAINKSFLIFFSFVMLSVLGTGLLSLIEVQPLQHIMFEVLSALTNTGLSMGITSGLNDISKVILMVLMVIGRIGIFALIYLIFNVDQSKVKYLEEDLAVG